MGYTKGRTSGAKWSLLREVLRMEPNESHKKVKSVKSKLNYRIRIPPIQGTWLLAQYMVPYSCKSLHLIIKKALPLAGNLKSLLLLLLLLLSN